MPVPSKSPSPAGHWTIPIPARMNPPEKYAWGERNAQHPAAIITQPKLP